MEKLVPGGVEAVGEWTTGIRSYKGWLETWKCELRG
jgi:hypothetical protein